MIYLPEMKKLCIFAHMSSVSNPIHAVINTRGRRMTIRSANREALYRFIWSVLRERGCNLYRIGGIENHVHILFDLSPRYALMDVMRDVKRESSKWMKQSGLFPDFDGWGKEYFAYGRSRENLGRVIEYIKGQPEHHGRGVSFENEMERLVTAEGLQWGEHSLT